MKYIHCSWDILEPDSLVPRVPETIITGPNVTEDSKTPRICVAGSVQDALKSIPGCGIMIRNMRKYHIPLIIHAYYLEQDPQYVYKPTDAEVPDAAYTGEYWMLRSPQKVRRRDYLLFDPVCISGKDLKGKETLEDADVVQIFASYEAGVAKLGEAKVGDKTFLDGLHPAVESLQASLAAGESLADMAGKAADAAEEGFKATTTMLAVHGRAATRGEASRSLEDPGAKVASLIMQAFAKSL